MREVIKSPSDSLAKTLASAIERSIFGIDVLQALGPGGKSILTPVDVLTCTFAITGNPDIC